VNAQLNEWHTWETVYTMAGGENVKSFDLCKQFTEITKKICAENYPV